MNVPGDGSIAPDFRRSDHATFWDENIPALLITDGGNFRNPNYHLPTDVVDSLNIPFMTKVIKASIAAILELGGAPPSSRIAAIEALITFVINGMLSESTTSVGKW